jgi:hypothetical protein
MTRDRSGRTITHVALADGVEIVAATRDVEFAMIRRAFECYGAAAPFLAPEERETTRNVAVRVRRVGPLRAGELAKYRVAPREEGAPSLLFFCSLYPDTVKAFREGDGAAQPTRAAGDIEALVRSLAPPRSFVLLLNVFRHVSPAGDTAATDSRRLRDRIRRFNREALRMATAGQVALVDLDDAMAREGARSLGCDHACDSEPAIDRGARAVARAVLALPLPPGAAGRG